MSGVSLPLVSGGGFTGKRGKFVSYRLGEAELWCLAAGKVTDVLWSSGSCRSGGWVLGGLSHSC